MKMKLITVLTAGLTIGPANAALVNFEGTTTGASINGQAGWTVADVWGNQTDFDGVAPGVQRPDEQVVDLSGNKVWRLSDAYTRTTYSDHAFSQVSEQVAGETGSSLWNDFGPDHTMPYNPPHFGANAASNQFHASLDFKSVTGAPQAGLSATLSPSAKQSRVRMSYLKIDDNGSNGFNLTFIDTSSGSLNFDTHTVATGLSYADWHNIAMDITFVDGVSAGTNGNDVVTISVDGSPVYTGTTWESYYYDAERIDPLNPRLQAVDSMLFRVAGTPHPGNLGNGFYFDNVEISNVVPEPSSLSLLALGGVALLRRRCQTTAK